MTTTYNPSTVFPPYANYAHAVEVPAGARTLYISGLNGYDPTGQTMPSTFEAQARLIWQHLATILAEAGMTYTNLVSLRFYLADPADDPTNVALIKEHLGTHQAARTVITTRLLDPTWRLELEAIAAA